MSTKLDDAALAEAVAAAVVKKIGGNVNEYLLAAGWELAEISPGELPHWYDPLKPRVDKYERVPIKDMFVVGPDNKKVQQTRIQMTPRQWPVHTVVAEATQRARDKMAQAS